MKTIRTIALGFGLLAVVAGGAALEIAMMSRLGSSFVAIFIVGLILWLMTDHR